MLRFVVRRFIAGGIVIFSVTVVVFLVARVISDPAAVRLAGVGTEEQIQALRVQLGLDRPVWVQFLDYLRGLPQLDLGNSLWQGIPARDLIIGRIPATFMLLGASLLLTVIVFVPLGVLAALRPGTALDRAIVALSLGGISAPPFWVGAILILIFAVGFGILPSSGAGTLKHMILPAICLALPSGARVAQIARTTMIEQMSSPYVSALRGRGFSNREILSRHVLRNAALPIVTILFYEAAQLVSGSVIIETVFAWPGLGRLLIQAFTQQDIIILQGGVLVLAVLVVVVNVLADIVYKAVDPRVELS